jgi:tetraacyldisaccharide 4'-kinase
MAVSGMAQRLPGCWYRRRLAVALWPLLPLSWLFVCSQACGAGCTAAAYCTRVACSVPVVVVGNLTVGGSGKTPLVLWLVQRLREPGLAAGNHQPRLRWIAASQVRLGMAFLALSSLVGDEPLMLARRSGVPVFVGRDRVAAGQALLAAHPDCDVIVSDDGLQHYRLKRTVQVVVFDSRGAGNGRLLPAGPLREPLRRLAGVDAVVWNGPAERRVEDAARHLPQFDMRLVGQRFVAISGRQSNCDADFLKGRQLHAIAGIGDPRRFFSQLKALGLEFEEHPFPDHHPYSDADLAFARHGVLLMTEKDAVKCEALVTGEAWVLPVEAVITSQPGQAGLLETILEKLHGRPPA